MWKNRGSGWLATLALAVSGGLIASPVTARASTAQATIAAGALSYQTLAAADSFNRTVANGWGNADDGGAWSSAPGYASGFSTSAGAGILTDPAAQGGGYWMMLNSVVAGDTEATGTVTLALPSGTQCAYQGFVSRGGDTERLDWCGGGTVEFVIAAYGGGWLCTADSGIPASSNLVLHFRFDTQGSYPTTLRGRIWTGSSEPGTWLASCTDSTPAQQSPGAIGWGFWNPDPSNAIVQTVNSFTVYETSAVSFPAVQLNGANQTITAPFGIEVDDATGSGSGWNMTLQGSQFTTGSYTLPTTATTVQGAPTIGCDGASACTSANDTVSYPLTVPVASPARIFNASPNTGMGTIDIITTFSLAIPANSFAGSYTSTWTFSLVSGP